MFTIRNLGGVALLLAGSTWLWLTPAFAGRGVTTSGAFWAVTRVLALATVAAFCLATWALFTRQSWWELATLASALVGVVALVAYGVAAIGGGEPSGTATWNVFVHAVMLAGIFVLLLVPQLEQWVNRHVMGG